jgi:hypothetical protein
VIALGFAAGIWKGQIDTRLDSLQRNQDELKVEVKGLGLQVAEQGKSISYLQGSLQGANLSSAHGQQR